MSELPQITRWLAAIRGGRREALGSLFEFHRPRLRLMIQLRLHPRVASRVDPSDVLQEVFLDAERQIRGYLDQPAVGTYVWLRKLAWERLLKVHRQHLGTQRRNAALDVTLPDGSSHHLVCRLADGAPSPLESILKSESQRMVTRSLERLRPADRDVILLRVFEGMTNQEVAELLGVSEAAAAMRFGRALFRLKQALIADFDLEGPADET